MYLVKYLKKITIVGIFFLFFPVVLLSQNSQVDELKSKIEERENIIKKIEQEISVYNQEVIKTSSEANSLKNTIKVLDTTDKKLKKDINLTENKITKTVLTIEDTSKNIEDTLAKIDINKKAILESLNNINEKDNISLVEAVISFDRFTDFWGEVDRINDFKMNLKSKVFELKELKDDLESRKKDYEKEKNNLSNFKQDLVLQKKIVEDNKKEKSTILTLTKNKEQAYKDLVRQKELEKDKFERELFEYESQLKYEIDKSKLPDPKKGILSWPLESVYITQYFGKTNASKRLYVSGSHNGVDFRASLGTKVLASLSGVVWGTGDTDKYPGCYSFGKWVMVKHPNGLSTIYAHLSSIKVSEGQTVSTGDVIGFSGNTGYSTGPHLHLGVYATEGVRIEKYTNSRGCKEARMPLADIRAYLDPMLYLPGL
jgi:murein DD-endopeptidase MepM/ murein hydrolase activator NlpD